MFMSKLDQVYVKVWDTKRVTTLGLKPFTRLNLNDLYESSLARCLPFLGYFGTREIRICIRDYLHRSTSKTEQRAKGWPPIFNIGANRGLNPIGLNEEGPLRHLQRII
jgi:hypothetical protein